ncbi:MAG: hypothetical protein KAW17_01700 [Candidatus Eisenbacteria sp.]|nr:hypothetical protein [Candidatus Eisenbacteria bacterium]
MGKDETRSTNLISDVPASKDEFGSHDRIAKAIVQLLRTESGGKTIGLQGTWGSGKSTVVNLVKEELDRDREKKQGEVAVVIVDAWAHQGDPLRRTFLERVIDGLDWIKDKEKWQQSLNKISRGGKLRRDNNASAPHEGGSGVRLAATVCACWSGFPAIWPRRWISIQHQSEAVSELEVLSWAVALSSACSMDVLRIPPSLCEGGQVEHRVVAAPVCQGDTAVPPDKDC